MLKTHTHTHMRSRSWCLVGGWSVGNFVAAVPASRDTLCFVWTRCRYVHLMTCSYETSFVVSFFCKLQNEHSIEETMRDVLAVLCHGSGLQKKVDITIYIRYDNKSHTH